MWCMKRSCLKEMKVIKGEHFREVAGVTQWPYPFEEALLDLLKEENPWKQEYYYIEDGTQYALFTLYHMRLNIFTFGKLCLKLPVKVIGYPCSLSEAGYLTNSKELLLRYVREMKGATLVLNAGEADAAKDFCVGETLPTCVFVNRFATPEQYLASLRSSYRRRIRKALSACGSFSVEEWDGKADIYSLYVNTYEKSDYKLERLEWGFFERIEGVRLVFSYKGEARGFVLLRQVEDTLVFMLCGMDYRYETADLYYFMIYTILEYGMKQGCRRIDLGQTSEETKLKFGAVLEKRFFYAHHSNPFLNGLVKLGKSLLAYHYKFPEYRVYLEGKHESIVTETGI